MNSKKSPNKKNEAPFAKALLLAIACFIALFVVIYGLVDLLGFTASRHNPAQNIFYARLAAFLSSVTIILLIYLLAKYIAIYLEMKSEFTIGLILVVLAMLADSITSNPLMHWEEGFPSMSGPFVFIPLFFTLLTSLVLIYLVHK